MRVLAASLCLAACTLQPNEVPLPADLTPIEIESVQRNLLAANPDTSAFSALSADGTGVIFAVDGTATFVDPTNNQRIETTVSGFSENTMCVAEAGSWPGLCIDLYQDATGGYICEGTFGDGQALNYACTLAPVARET